MGLTARKLNIKRRLHRYADPLPAPIVSRPVQFKPTLRPACSVCHKQPMMWDSGTRCENCFAEAAQRWFWHRSPSVNTFRHQHTFLDWKKYTWGYVVFIRFRRDTLSPRTILLASIVVVAACLRVRVDYTPSQ
jgi:hypothetical protein